MVLEGCIANIKLAKHHDKIGKYVVEVHEIKSKGAVGSTLRAKKVTLYSEIRNGGAPDSGQY